MSLECLESLFCLSDLSRISWQCTNQIRRVTTTSLDRLAPLHWVAATLCFFFLLLLFWSCHHFTNLVAFCIALAKVKRTQFFVINVFSSVALSALSTIPSSSSSSSTSPVVSASDDRCFKLWKSFCNDFELLFFFFFFLVWCCKQKKTIVGFCASYSNDDALNCWCCGIVISLCRRISRIFLWELECLWGT